MGLWDTVGKVAKAGYGQLKESANEVEEKMEHFDSYSDEKLIGIYTSNSRMNDKSAVGNLLKERGYRLIDGEWE